MRHPYRTIGLAIVSVVLLTGCSTLHTFKLILTVKNAGDGQPVEGATVVLDDTLTAAEHKQQLDRGSPLGETNAEGKLTHEFKISGYTSRSGPWYLKIQKDGFEPQVLDVSPKQDFNSREPIPLPVVVGLKPLPKQP